jgi:hypothetical protein
MDEKLINGFSKLDKHQKIEWLQKYFLKDNDDSVFQEFWHPEKKNKN